MKSGIFLKTFVIGFIFFTSVVAEEQVVIDKSQEKSLEEFKANEIEAIEFSVSVEKLSSDSDKKMWQQMILDGKNLMVNEDGVFIDKLGEFVEKCISIVSEDKSSMNGFLSVRLLSKRADEEVLNNSEWTKVIGKDVAVDDAKKITYKFIVQRCEGCESTIWENIFDIAHEYAVWCKDSVVEGFDILTTKFKEILQKIYDFSKGTKASDVDLDISIVNIVQID
jgi:hypothetical protein